MKEMICIICFLILISCGKPEPLPNGYSISRRDSGKYEIVSPPYIGADGVTLTLGMINPDVTKIAVLGELVVGYADTVKEVDGLMTPGGFFLLNTKSKATKEGLTLVELRKLLASEHQIYEEPKFELIHRY